MNRRRLENCRPALIRDGHLVARKLGRGTIITDHDLREFFAGVPCAGGHEQA